MSNEISKFYQFLANQGQNWTEVADSKYGNDDGSVIKAEFKEFINAEWNGEEMGLDLTSDLVNQFWKKIDSNQSTSVIKGTNNIRNYNALDSKEVENLENRIVAYQQFNEYSDEYIKSPGVFSSSDADWKNDVETELMTHLEEWITDGCQGDLVEYLEQYRPAIETKYTAQYCATEYQNELVKDVLKDYPDYKIADDSSLQDLINTYVKNISGSEVLPDADSIKEEIRDIIDAYFATAGLGSDSEYDLSTLGYAPNADSGLNDIQKEVITAKLKSNLSSITSSEDYEKYQTLYDEAINTYISDILSSTKYGDFETVLNKSAEDFKSTDGYKNLINRVEATSVLNDLSVGSDFYNAIVETLGQTIADKLAIDYKFLGGVYDDIINEALEKVQNGEFLKSSALKTLKTNIKLQSAIQGNGIYAISADRVTGIYNSGLSASTADVANVDIDALLEWVTTQLAANLNEIYSNGYGDMPLEELNSLYNKLFEEGMVLADSDPDKAGEMIKDAALSYCEALLDKGDSMKNAISEVFGDNYKTFINSANISEIKELMEELIAKATEIGDIANFTIGSWSGLDDSLMVEAGKSSSFNIGADIKDTNGNSIDSSRITYQATVKSGTGTVSISNSTLSVSTTAAEGSFEVQVAAYVDGIQIGEAKTVKVNIKPDYSTIVNNVQGWDGRQSSHIEAYNGSTGSDIQVTSMDFAELYNGGYSIQLVRAKNYMDHKRSSKIMEKDKTTEQLNTAKARLVELGSFVVSALATSGLDKSILQAAVDEVVASYQDHIQHYNKSGGYGDSSSMSREAHNYVESLGEKSGGNLYAVTENSGHVSICVMLDFKEFVDDILEKYYSMV